MAVTWDAVKEGQELPTLDKNPGVTQLVKYAAGSGDFNPLHHDYAFPQSKQIGSIIVHGRFKYASLGELVSNWLGHNGRIQKLSCQYRGMDMPNSPIRCKGVVKKKWEAGGQKLAELDIWTENGKGEKTTPGSATVIFR
jgi:acyl dehydratase